MPEEPKNTIAFNFLTQNMIPISILTLPFIFYFIFKHSRRISSINDLPRTPGFEFNAFVSRVGDGDGFWAIHVPLLRCVSKTAMALPVRLAGIDAPEVRYFSRPEQPFSREARDELRALILHRVVKIRVLDIDTYGRIIGIVYVGLWRKNVNIEMVRKGLACVYTGTCVSFEGMKEKLVEVEKKAKEKRIGIWSQEDYISPMEFKRRNKI